MKKRNIIKKNTDFEKIINNRRNYNNVFFSIYILHNNENQYRFGISIPKKIGKAVLRNKLKRQLKDIIDKNFVSFPNLDYVIIVKKKILDIQYEEIKKELLSLMTRINPEEEKR